MLPVLLLALACHPGSKDTGDATWGGLLAEDPLLPWPSFHHLADDDGTATGVRLAIPEDLLPVPIDGTALDVARLNRRDGFSPAGTLVVLFPDHEVDPGSLPHQEDPSGSVLSTSTVQIIDLESGEREPLFAEMDAWPDSAGPEERALLIRPLQAMAFGTRHAVVLTTALRQSDGSPLPPPERFAALRDGQDPPPGLEGWVDHYEDLFDRLEGEGIPREDLLLAWDFVVASQDNLTRPLDVVLEGMRDATSEDPPWEISSLQTSEEGAPINGHVWREVKGTFRLPTWVGDDLRFVLDGQGDPTAQGEADAPFTLVVPASLQGAPAGSAPVVVFGHGFLASPDFYLADENDGNDVLALLDRMGAIGVGLPWTGLSTSELIEALGAASDFGRLPIVTDRLTEAVARAEAVPRILHGGFGDASFLQAAAGGSLVDPARTFWYGISLGSIEGAVVVANSDELHYAVLHVGGSVWSTMLERSCHWHMFETALVPTLPDPVDRQVLYAASQVLWDPADPINYAAALATHSVLSQESMGDDQVPNISTETLARSVGLPILVPAVEAPWGLDIATAPLGPDASALTQYDPGRGRNIPWNRPSDVTGAHEVIRLSQEVQDQIVTFLGEGTEGTIIHPCGDVPCMLEEP